MRTEIWKNKQKEREKLLKMYYDTTQQMPDFDGSVRFDHEWHETHTKIRELEIALQKAGVAL